MSNRQLPLGVLKATPETFIVQELTKSNPPRAVEFYEQSLIRGWEGDNVTVFGMSKRRQSNEEALKEVAHQLGISVDDISTHGRKDKHACTSQHIGVRGDFHPAFSHPNISLVQLYGQDRPLTHSGHWGNRFKIFIFSAADKLDFSAAMAVPNLFGPQRVGWVPGQEQVGRLFLEGNPEAALKLLFSFNREAKRKFLQAKRLAGGSWEEALSHPEFEETLTFEIQKWQSYLWNQLLKEKKEKLGAGLPDLLPLWNQNREVSQMYKHLWDPSRSQLNQMALNFVVKHDRPTMFRPTGFHAEYDADAIGWNFKFDLRGGVYATELLLQLFNLEEEEHRYLE